MALENKGYSAPRHPKWTDGPGPCLACCGYGELHRHGVFGQLIRAVCPRCGGSKCEPEGTWVSKLGEALGLPTTEG